MSGSGCVLLIEDDDSDVIFLKRAFVKAGLPHRLQVAEDGRRAIDYLSGAGRYADREKHPIPTHVLLDLKLPEKTGFEVLEWIRNEPSLRSPSSRPRAKPPTSAGRGSCARTATS